VLHCRVHEGAARGADVELLAAQMQTAEPL